VSPHISVIISTTRVGGLDVIFSGLQGQTFQDFELVLIDNLYEYRKSIVAKQAKQYSFPVKHLPPRGTGFTAATWCRDQNTGLINASGNLAFFIGDYSWLHSECLAIHANFHKDKPNDRCALLCAFDLSKLPALHADFKRTYAGTAPYDTEVNKKLFIEQEQQYFNNYVMDLQSGALDGMMWSIFEEPFLNPNALERTDARAGLSMGVVDNRQCFLRNESFVLDDMIEINGFNEALDGSHGWQDWEFIDRASVLLGTTLYGNPVITATNVNPRSIMYCRNRSRGVYDNESIWKHGLDVGFQDRVNDWSLKAIRQEMKGHENDPNK
jgi:hypothetical protein